MSGEDQAGLWLQPLQPLIPYLIPAAIQGSSVCRPDLVSSGKKIAKKEDFYLYFIEFEISKY